MKRIALVVSVLILVLSANVYAGINQEFRGLKWEDPPTRDMVAGGIKDSDIVYISFTSFPGYWTETLQGKSLKEAYIEVYTKSNENLWMGEVPLLSIVYMFFENRFMEARLYFSGKENYDTLGAICIEKYGTFVKHDWKFRWTLWEVSIEIFYNEAEKRGHMEIFEYYTKDCWVRKITTERKKLTKIAAKKTEGDW